MQRTGLFVCRTSCSKDLNVYAEALATRYRDRVEVVDVVDCLHGAAAHQQMAEAVRTRRLEAVVLGGCSPEVFRRTLGGDALGQLLAAEGVNPNHLGHANLREQVSLAHRGAAPEQLLAKAVAITDVALALVHTRAPLDSIEIPPRKSVLVLGNGPAALIAAHQLLRQQLKVTVVDRAPEWGLNGTRTELAMLSGVVMRDPHCHLAFGTELKRVTGWAGDYSVTVATGGVERQERFGAIVVAVEIDVAAHAHLWPMLQVDARADGTPLPFNEATGAVNTGSAGIKVLPITSGPGSLREENLLATSAAFEVGALLQQSVIPHPLAVTRVKPEDCGMCRTCVKVCAFGACQIDEVAGTSVVDERLCRGCGNCVVACPAGARDLLTSPSDYLRQSIDILARSDVAVRPRILALLCSGCAYRAVDAAALSGFSYPLGILPLQVTCGGRVDMQHVLHAFTEGFDGVVIGTCHANNCHNAVGHLYLDRRLVLMRELLRSRGFDPERVLVMDISPDEGEACAKALCEFADRIRGSHSEVH